MKSKKDSVDENQPVKQSPLKSPIIIQSNESNNKKKVTSFKFEVVSAKRQEQERNSAYQFFSID